MSLKIIKKRIMRNHFPVVPRIIPNRGGIREIIYSHEIKFRLTYAQSYTPMEVVRETTMQRRICSNATE